MMGRESARKWAEPCVLLLPGIKRQNFPDAIKSDNIKSNTNQSFLVHKIALCTYDSGFLQFLDS